jgi:hypothetical protein
MQCWTSINCYTAPVLFLYLLLKFLSDPHLMMKNPLFFWKTACFDTFRLLISSFRALLPTRICFAPFPSFLLVIALPCFQWRWEKLEVLLDNGCCRIFYVQRLQERYASVGTMKLAALAVFLLHLELLRCCWRGEN